MVVYAGGNMAGDAAGFGVLAKALCAGEGNLDKAQAWASRYGAAGRVQTVLRSATGAHSLASEASAGVLGDLNVLHSAFVESLRTSSVFYRLYDSGFRPIPTRARIGIVTTGATAWIRGEGLAKPISKVVLAKPELTERKAVGIIVITEELAQNMSPRAVRLFNNELRRAVSQTVDETFLSGIVDTATPTFASGGNSADAMRVDVLNLLLNVDSHDAAKLFFVFGVNAAKRAAMIDDGRGAMSPLGGEFLSLPALVSNQLDDDALMLIDADSFAADARTITLAASREATIEMETSPEQSAVAPTAQELVSLWQTNAVALKAEAYFGYEQIRQNAVAMLTDIEWSAPAESE